MKSCVCQLFRILSLGGAVNIAFKKLTLNQIIDRKNFKYKAKL